MPTIISDSKISFPGDYSPIIKLILQDSGISKQTKETYSRPIKNMMTLCHYIHVTGGIQNVLNGHSNSSKFDSIAS